MLKGRIHLIFVESEAFSWAMELTITTFELIYLLVNSFIPDVTSSFPILIIHSNGSLFVPRIIPLLKHLFLVLIRLLLNPKEHSLNCLALVSQSKTNSVDSFSNILPTTSSPIKNLKNKEGENLDALATDLHIYAEATERLNYLMKDNNDEVVETVVHPLEIIWFLVKIRWIFACRCRS